jgi:hypothetical protein
MINTHQNLLSEEELFFLDSYCTNFTDKKIDEADSIGNYYIRKQLNVENDLLEYQKRCKESIDKKYELFAIWINKVTTETNIDDIHHYDACDLSIVTYINDTFEGGEFEYIENDTFEGGEFEYIENENIFKIKPIRNMSLFMDNKLKHRVLKVTKNERFSLISFYRKIQKKEKTLI